MLGKVKESIKSYIDKRYEGWDLSIALRYLPIADDLRRIRRKGEKVLEIGSEITGITPYLKQKVVGVDLGFDYKRKNKYLDPVEGSATDLPFKDKEFDYVLSVDVLEHIPPSKRKKAIREAIRVARKKVYLSFPCGRDSELVDKRLDEYFFKKNGERFTYLQEHVENGLPNCEEIKGYLYKQKGWKVEVAGNTNIFLWELMLKLGLSNTPWKTSLYRRMLLFTPILKHVANFPPTYRKTFILNSV